MFLTGGIAVAAGYLIYKQAPPFFWKQLATETFQSVAPAPHRPDLSQWGGPGLRVAWLGHSTTLIELDGYRILTDPVFSERCGLGVGVGTIGPKRLVAPALDIADLGPIDLVLLSHAHFDHWDTPSLARLANPKTRVVCARETSDLLDRDRWKAVYELGWEEKLELGPITLRGMEVRHWGARVRRDTHRGYNGYVIEGAGKRVLFAGDTAMTDAFRKVKGKPIDLGIMPIGAYNPWVAAHCNPEEAVEMAGMAGVERILPVHHQTFVLSREPVGEPIERLMTRLGREPERAVAWEVGREWRLA